MAYGIGPVHMMMLMGFVVGYFTATGKTSSGSFTIQFVGIACLAMGIMSMFARNPINGRLGGLLTGFGLGATIASY